MLLSHFKRLCITSATLIAASPLATVVPKSTSLPFALQQAVPSCAQTCVQASLAEKFPVACSGQENIQCLCSRYSNSGESLGEVALGCVYTACSMVDQGAASAYNVCLGQRDAVMPTKSVLTVVASSTPRTTSTMVSKSIAAPTPTPTTTLRTTGTSTQSIIIDSISSTQSETSSPTSTFVAVPAATNPPPKMTPAQIAGLSVAAVAAFVIAVGLMALSVCLRRKRERKNAFDSDEKGSSTKSNQLSSRFSNFVAAGSIKVPSSRFAMAIPPAACKGGKHVKLNANKVKNQDATLRPIRPVQRNGVGTSNSSSDSSLPLSQIGVAISAELDGTSAVPRITTQAPSLSEGGRPKQSQLSVPFRPVSTMTQDTVFEEDETTARRRSSALLPTPPVPVAPIRSLQPSQRAATFDTAFGSSVQPKATNHKFARRSELFLEIPARHERPQPRRIITAQMPSTGSPQQLPGRPNWSAPPTQLKASASPQKTPGSSDIDDYYFSTHQNTKPLPISGYAVRIRDSPKSMNVRTKRSGSTVSRTASRASTNFRDSGSSQTSFETADPSDPTPDDEDADKQLSDDAKLSPVAESPISKLRYPKIPRASNQLVPRSPRSPQHAHPFKPSRTPRRNQPSPPSTSHLLHNRHKDLAPLLLETRLPLKLNAPKDVALVPRAPLKDPFISPPRARTHGRSNSTESWSTTPRSKIDRKSRTQSVASPDMYEEPMVIRPLNVRRKRDEMQEINVGRDVDHDAEGLRSPVWIPKLTPTKKGNDLFISVGWGGR